METFDDLFAAAELAKFRQSKFKQKIRVPLETAIKKNEYIVTKAIKSVLKFFKCI